MTDFNFMAESLVACDGEKLKMLVNRALTENVSANDILNKGLIAGMDIVGGKMETGEMFIPEVLMAAKTMDEVLEMLKPLLGDDQEGLNNSVVIGTVKGDLHDIGKNLVKMMLESSGMQVHDLGIDVPPEKFVEKIKETDAKIVCISALLTTTMPMMQQTIDAITASDIREQVKIMVGGAPVNQRFADEIGADGYAPDAGSAAKLAKSFA